ncbi:hypothetical protein [Rhizobium sp. RAF56]|uniref:hypothetical protein n=1 Tax=Rhizobium sp. RAF56 TaxID=3233062 RepID=UPI003F9CA2AE
MALSDAEKAKRYRQRQKQAEQDKDRTLLDDVFQRPFFESYEPHDTDFTDLERYFDYMGLPLPQIRDDSDPASFSGEVELGLGNGEGYYGFAGYKRSLGKAEVIMNGLQLAAQELARMIAEYKASEIKARIGEIEALDLSDPGLRRKAMGDLVRLQKMLDQLDNKQVKWNLPQWRVTGE